MRNLIAALAAILALLFLGYARADEPAQPLASAPVTRFTQPLTCLDAPDNGYFVLPPGYYFPDDKFGLLSIEVYRLQKAEQTLTIDNQMLQRQLDAKPRSAKVFLGALGSSFLAGGLVVFLLTR